jgi:hypothetical protein
MQQVVRTENVMENDDPASDFTKTKLYVSVDLASKVISAIALVVLGVVGWMLQLHTEKSREAAENFERQERRYLPMLRSLSALELKLEDASKAWPSFGASYSIGTELRFTADSVFEPEGDPLVWVRDPRTSLINI